MLFVDYFLVFECAEMPRLKPKHPLDHHVQSISVTRERKSRRNANLRDSEGRKK